MPTNLVKTDRDEELWSKAKSRAAEQGHKEDWAYINGIYQRMKGHTMKTASLLSQVKSAAVLHTYPDVEEYGIGSLSSSHVRKQSLEQMANMAKRDLLIMRPKVAPKQKREAGQIAETMLGWGYSKSDLIRTALAPGSISDDTRNSLICSALIAKAYPGIKFRGDYSARSVRPGDIHSSEHMREVAAFSKHGKDGIKGNAKGLRLGDKTKVYSDLDKFRKKLKPGDVILMKPSVDYRQSGRSGIFEGASGLFGKLKKKFNKDDYWVHAALWTEDEEGRKVASMKLSDIRKIAFTEADIQANINQRQNIANAFGGNRNNVNRVHPVAAMRNFLGMAKNINQQVKSSSLQNIRSQAAMDLE